VAHVKEPSLINAINDQHRPKFAALSPLKVTAKGKLKDCSDDYKQKRVTNTYIVTESLKEKKEIYIVKDR
jgi:hypothetical protein